jgi:hypothetical protein
VPLNSVVSTVQGFSQDGAVAPEVGDGLAAELARLQ